MADLRSRAHGLTQHIGDAGRGDVLRWPFPAERTYRRHNVSTSVGSTARRAACYAMTAAILMLAAVKHICQYLSLGDALMSGGL